MLLKQYRTIEQMCSDAHSITLRFNFKAIQIHSIANQIVHS